MHLNETFQQKGSLMKLSLKWRLLSLLALTIFFFTAQMSVAQVDTAPKKRLRSPATVRGFIGGESQDLYVIRARKGRTMTVQISWRKEDDNTAGFGVSPAPDGEQLPGQASDNSRRWTGKITKTGDYIISVTAHPSAHYRLRVTVK
jgi:hypothetical protein